MESMDKVHGQCPAGVLERKQWTISRESMENVHGFFPWNPWIFSMESMDIVQGESGQCPWKLFMDILMPLGCPVQFGAKYIFWASKNRKFM